MIRVQFYKSEHKLCICVIVQAHSCRFELVELYVGLQLTVIFIININQLICLQNATSQSPT